MNKSHLLRVAVAVGMIAAPASANGDKVDEKMAVRTALTRSKISLSKAVQIARAEVPDGKPVEAELGMEGDTATYEVRLVAGDRFMSVRIDAVTGNVLQVEEDKASSAAWCFDKDKPGTVPPGWCIRQTNPTKSMAAWHVIPDAAALGRGNVLALTQSKNYDGTYNLAIAENTSFKDLDLIVKVKAVHGEEDQGGGPIWRCKDENNYYICRFNPLEANFRVYFVKDGRRKQLRSAKVETRPGKWYTVRVRMIGNQIICYLDGEKLLEARDDTFKDAGAVGLWTKADAVTSFDDFSIESKEQGH